MNEPDSDERLRAAFRHAPAASDPLPEDLQEQIWLAVSGDLDPEQRRALVDRTSSDAAAAEAWRIATALWEARQAEGGLARGVQPSATPAPVRRHPVWTSPWLAAAAALVLISTVVTLQYRRTSSGDEFRVAPDAAIESLIPEGASLPRDEFRLRWTPGPDNARYRLRVTTEDLRVVTTVEDLMRPDYLVPPDVLAGFSAGTTLLWQVEMALPTGQTMTSSTFFIRIG